MSLSISGITSYSPSFAGRDKLPNPRKTIKEYMQGYNYDVVRSDYRDNVMPKIEAGRPLTEYDHAVAKAAISPTKSNMKHVQKLRRSDEAFFSATHTYRKK